MFLLAVGIALLLVVAVFAVGRRVGAQGWVALASLVLLAAIWVAALALEQRGWRDTDGWIDCNPHCTGWHHLGLVLIATPVLTGAMIALVLAGGLVVKLVRGRTGRNNR